MKPQFVLRPPAADAMAPQPPRRLRACWPDKYFRFYGHAIYILSVDTFFGDCVFVASIFVVVFLEIQVL